MRHAGVIAERYAAIAPDLPRIHDATLFAVTVERPGVVVSKRERVVVTAARS